MPSRRDFLVTLPIIGLAPLALTRLTRGRERLRILVLGGTNFTGPHLVSVALERGHEVTLFNRGLTNPHLFPELEKLRCDRYPHRGDGPAALDTERTWDAVIDTWQEAPGASTSLRGCSPGAPGPTSISRRSPRSGTIGSAG